MKRNIVFVLSFLFCALCVLAEEVVRVGLFGGSSVATSYLPKEERHDQVLLRELEKRYPGQRFEVRNFAFDGEFIARFLLSGRYERTRRLLIGKGLDVAIVRFGINDQKYVDEAEFGRQLRAFVDLLRTDFPGVTVFLETAIFVDYPAHYHYDREKVLSPYWDITRAVAEDMKLPVSDYHASSKAATQAGKWDLRIRLTEREKDGFVLDASRDAEHAGDAKWFSDIHPNHAGIQLAAETEADALMRVFPNVIPTGSRSADHPPKDATAYSALLDFSPERLTRQRKAAPVDRLQTPAAAP